MGSNCPHFLWINNFVSVRRYKIALNNPKGKDNIFCNIIHTKSYQQTTSVKVSSME